MWERIRDILDTDKLSTKKLSKDVQKPETNILVEGSKIQREIYLNTIIGGRPGSEILEPTSKAYRSNTTSDYLETSFEFVKKRLQNSENDLTPVSVWIGGEAKPNKNGSYKSCFTADYDTLQIEHSLTELEGRRTEIWLRSTGSHYEKDEYLVTHNNNSKELVYGFSIERKSSSLSRDI